MAEIVDNAYQRDHAIFEVTENIVAAYVAKNSVSRLEIGSLIHTVHSTLQRVVSGASVSATSHPPAVSIKKSVTPDYLICLEDGARLKTLKRYLQRFDLTPEQYRARWGLPHDYPMVAPNYSARRSQLAKASGLGRVPRPKKGTGEARKQRPR